MMQTALLGIVYFGCQVEQNAEEVVQQFKLFYTLKMVLYLAWIQLILFPALFMQSNEI